MSRDTSPLGGQELLDAQIPVSLVQLAIPSFSFNNICDIDAPVYLNTSTNAVSMAPGSGLTQFSPYAGLTVPQIDEAEDEMLSDVAIVVSNQNGDWYGASLANAYKETLVSIWQGNIIMSPGTAPDAATFQGVVKRYLGRLEYITHHRKEAQLHLSPHILSFSMLWPYRTYSAPEFLRIPAQGTVIKVGLTSFQV